MVVEIEVALSALVMVSGMDDRVGSVFGEYCDHSLVPCFISRGRCDFSATTLTAADGNLCVAVLGRGFSSS